MPIRFTNDILKEMQNLNKSKPLFNPNFQSEILLNKTVWFFQTPHTFILLFMKMNCTLWPKIRYLWSKGMIFTQAACTTPLFVKNHFVNFQRVISFYTSWIIAEIWSRGVCTICYTLDSRLLSLDAAAETCFLFSFVSSKAKKSSPSKFIVTRISRHQSSSSSSSVETIAALRSVIKCVRSFCNNHSASTSQFRARAPTI